MEQVSHTMAVIGVGSETEYKDHSGINFFRWPHELIL